MNDDRCYIAGLEKRVAKQRKRVKELKGERDEYWGYVEQYRAEAQEGRKVVDRQEATLQLRQNLINQREGERDEYKNMCEEYEGEVADLGNKIDQLEAELLTMSETKDEELQKVVAREHAIHNEAGVGMINKIKELEQANSKLLQELEYTKALLTQHVEAAGDRPTSLERDFTRALNHWGGDSDLDTADFILANFLVRQLYALKAMKAAEKKHGIPPTRVVSDEPTALDQLTEKVMLRNARLASISIDEDGLGTIDVIE